MEIVDTGSRHRSALPALNRLDTDEVAHDGVDRHRKGLPSGLTISTGPLPSPTTTYPGPPPPFSSSSSATPSNLGTFEYISPPSSRRTTMDDKVSVQRQSLPSIQEVLGVDGTLPFSVSNIVTALPVTARLAQQGPSFVPGQSLPEAPSGPPNPFSQGPTVSQTLEHDLYHATQTETLSEREKSNSAFPTPSNTECLSASVHTLKTKSPKPSSAHPIPTNTYHQPANPSNYGASTKLPSSQFTPYPSPYSYPTEPPNPPAAAFQPAPDYSRFNPAFKFDDRKSSIPRSHPVQPYSDSVKRHLEIFDIELALAEVTDGSHRTLEFSRLWSLRAHPRQRTGHLPENFPTLPELDDLMRQSGRVGEALGRIKEAVIAQQHAFAQEQARVHKREHYEDELAGYPGEYKENGSFSPGDSKKRRGKAAPPGRCHSCNRAETPEWRRGPDGARTLCNACGLHYAKLTRKMAVNKNAALPGSNLRPKHPENHAAI